jgi:hypothetical protein
MVLCQDLIRDAMRLSGSIQSTEALTAEQAQDHLRTLNRMIDAWNIDRLIVYTIDANVYTLVANQQDYTMGPGGTLDPAFRPVRIEEAYIRLLSGATPYDRPLKIVQDEGWADIGVKGVASPVPTILYNHGDFPVTTISLWPTPSVANQIVLYCWHQLSQVTDINATLNFPPGYEEAILYNLAARVAGEYGMTLDAYSLRLADMSLQRIKSVNVSPIYLSCDSALLSKNKGLFNYLTGDFGRH